MNLDLRTMLVMISALNLLFSGLLALVELHADNIRGVRQWAIGCFCTGLGLSFAYTQLEPPGHPWALILGATFTLAGAGFQFNGIQLFKTRQCNPVIPWLLAGLTFLQSIWFVLFYPDIHSRTIINSILLCLINAASARALFVHIEQPLRTAYWFTALGFTVLTTMFLIEAIIIFLSPANTYGLYSQIPLNPVSFFTASMAQMSIAFGFVLMVNYRLTANHQKLASTDGLTGVMNRRSLEEESIRLLARCSRTDEVLSVMMIDVDHFKSINDRYGHQAGDEVLKRLAVVAQQSIRSNDYLARYGGEEFCILLPTTLEKDAWKLADRLRQSFAAMSIEFDGEVLCSTISIGIADTKHAGLEFASLIVAADKAMYRAKHDGRNRVIMYSVHARA
ncbi:diguanylate cyclase (GGDEF) domain-containing protein [Nitrosomonas cryotolerans]|uniref:diguanylate cyclase n=1 Tax=Nitrosomonas cryotolerans ATCC 49181 TaxID=1131553 RepID=A0A1N6IVQ2_9PROT|nr:GGDEF domain-containing protein [Nitrosomonas cryotolerans]SFP90477.1 diguanylate cyclase (GGDEF) domain-containing protein [Nitrosomonas cryotolerans]SIO36094.1 diguanylate cyclase (GGDEF) domain-containing protein [Nitrosomonas cryotolerans ATCC 49181]